MSSTLVIYVLIFLTASCGYLFYKFEIQKKVDFELTKLIFAYGIVMAELKEKIEKLEKELEEKKQNQ